MPLILTHEAAEKRFQISKYDPVNVISNDQVLLLDGDTTIHGDLDPAWVSRTLEEAGENPDYDGLLIIVNGHLTVDGDIRFSDYRPSLLVLGDVHCHVLKSGNELIHITGNAHIQYAYYGYYNDGSICIAGKTHVPYVLNADHHSDLKPVDSILINVYSDYEDYFVYDYTQKDLEHVIVPALMKDSLSLDIWAFIGHLKAGLSPFKPGAKTQKQAAEERLAQLIETDPLSFTTLDLTDQKFRSFPTGITALKNLRVLTLSANKITSIPASIAALENLEELYLKDCALESIDIGALHQLRVLDISQNGRLKNLPGLPNLQVLKMDHNDLPITEPMPSLQEISMYACCTDGDSPAAFPAVLLQSKQLRKLDIRQNRFASLPHALTQLPLEEILWTDSTCATPIPDFSASKTLKKLVISKCYGQWRHVVFNISTLEHLQIDRNNEEKQFFDEELLSLWQEMIIAEPEKYGHFASLMENKQPEPDGGYSVTLRQGITTQQLEELAKLPHLTFLDLSWNKLEKLPESLYGLTKLVYLDLRHNQLSAAEKERVSNTFKAAEVLF